VRSRCVRRLDGPDSPTHAGRSAQTGPVRCIVAQTASSFRRAVTVASRSAPASERSALVSLGFAASGFSSPRPHARKRAPRRRGARSSRYRSLNAKRPLPAHRPAARPRLRSGFPATSLSPRTGRVAAASGRRRSTYALYDFISEKDTALIVWDQLLAEILARGLTDVSATR